MRTMLLASAFIVVIAGPALACRGMVEYPQVITQLEQSSMPSEQKDDLMAQLLVGHALHQEGHRQGEKAKRAAALRILDWIKSEIGK